MNDLKEKAKTVLYELAQQYNDAVKNNDSLVDVKFGAFTGAFNIIHRLDIFEPNEFDILNQECFDIMNKEK